MKMLKAHFLYLKIKVFILGNLAETTGLLLVPMGEGCQAVGRGFHYTSDGA